MSLEVKIDIDKVKSDVDELFHKHTNMHPILICIAGSHAYGLSTPNSDIDVRGVFISGLDNLLSEIDFNNGDRYYKQINDDKNDFVFYEVSRFLELVESNNPNILELLNTPDEFILYKHPVFDIILEYRDIFITKKVAQSFNGYATAQIKKARGQNKMIVNEATLVQKKDMMDFCYIILGGKTRPLKEWLEETNREQIFCGLAKIDHGNIQKVNADVVDDNTSLVGGLYALYYDQIAHYCFSSKLTKKYKSCFKKSRSEEGKPLGYGFKGIVNDNDVEGTDKIRVSNIPKEIVEDTYITNMVFNANGYSSHRKDYKKYQDWLLNRNPQRYKDNVSKGYKGFDMKNGLHCIRLLTMGEEILEGKGINVYRENDREYLLSIRNGEVDYDTLLDNADYRMSKIKELFENSDLPDKVDRKLLNSILIKVRKEFYNSSSNN